MKTGRWIVVFGCLVWLGGENFAQGWGATGPEVYYRFLHARLAERAGDFATALKEYEQVARLDPGALEVHRDLAKLYLRLGRIDEALKSAEHAKELAPEDPTSFVFLGGVRLLKGESTSAIEAYEQALALDPTNREALAHLGATAIEHDPPKAIAYFQRYLALEPQAAEIHYRLGLAYEQAGDARQAEAAFQRALAIAPELFTSQLALAELYEVRQSTTEAIQAYQRCAALAPHNPAVFLRLGALYERVGSFDEAEQSFRKAAALLPKDPSIQFWLARVAEAQQGWGKAAEYVQRAYDLSGDVQFIPLLAYYLTQDGHVGRAVRSLERAVRQAPERADVAFFLGVGYADLRRYRHAVRAFEAALAAQPEFSQARFQLGVVYDRLDQFDKASVQMQTVVEQDPTNAAALNYLGYAYAERGIRLAEAERLLLKAVQLQPRNGAFLDSLGWVHYRQGRVDQALEELTRAADLLPDPVIWEHLGDVHWAARHPGEAYGAWRHALALAPRQRGLRQKLRQAERTCPPEEQARQLVKVARIHLRQLNDFSGFLTVSGQAPTGRRWGGRAAVHCRISHGPPATAGGHPVSLRLTWVPPLGGPPVVMLFAGDRLVKGPSEGTDIERWIQRFTAFISGRALQALEQAPLQIERHRHTLIYRSSAVVAHIHQRRAVLTRLEWIEPNGTSRASLALCRYQQVRGIAFPRRLTLTDQEGTRLQARLDHLKVNQGLDEQLFELSPAPPP